MADIPYINQAQEVKITGQDATGLTVNYVGASSGGSLQVAGEGVAGTPAGGVVTIQGTPSGTSIPVQPAKGTLTDHSGSATSASVQMMAANSNRKFLFIQNNGGGDIWINFTTAATAAGPSIRLTSNSTFTMEGTFVSTEAIFVIRGSAPNQAYTAKEG